MKDGRHDGALQLLTPQGIPFGCGAQGTNKGNSCQLWLQSFVTFVSLERPKRQSALSVFAA
jgi:hypothetical protein